MKGLFVVCEGMDCAGKTSAIRKCLSYMPQDSAVYSKGLCSDSLMGILNRFLRSSISYLLEELYRDRTYINPGIEKDKIVLQDRWFYSILTFDESPGWMSKKLSDMLRKPDVFVYFTASKDERIRRLREKSSNHYHRYLLKHPETIDERELRFRKAYDTFRGPKYHIDTTSITEEDAGKMLCEIIQKEGNKRVN